MSTAVIPDLATGGDSSTSGSLNASIDSLDLSSLSDDSGVSLPDDISIPDTMVVGGKKRTEGEAPPETAEAKAARDATGKFAKKDATTETDPDAPVVEAAKPVPFRYRTMGETKELEGATEDADGNVIIPAAKRGEIRDALNAAQVVKAQYAPAIERYKADNAQLSAKVTELTETRGVNEAKAGALVEGLMQIAKIGDPSNRLQAAWDFLESLPRFQLEAEKTYWQEQAERATKAPAAASPKADPPSVAAPAAMPAPAEMVATTKEFIEQAKVHFPGLSEADWRQIETESAETPFAFYRLATAQDAQQYEGVQAGQVVFDIDKLTARITKPGTTAKETAEQRETERRRIELAASNARSTQSSIAGPPTPGGGKAPSGKSTGPKSKKELDDWYNSDDL